jgi:hypothetical protein
MQSDGSCDVRMVAPAYQPRPLPDGFLAALMKHGQGLKDLNIDFWELSYDRLRTLFETSPQILRLQILLDAPFVKLVSLQASCVFTHASS